MLSPWKYGRVKVFPQLIKGTDVHFLWGTQEEFLESCKHLDLGNYSKLTNVRSSACTHTQPTCLAACPVQRMRETILWKRLMDWRLYLHRMLMHKPMMAFLFVFGELCLGLVQLSRSWSKVGAQFLASLSTISHEKVLRSSTSVLRKMELKVSEQNFFISEATILPIPLTICFQHPGRLRHCEASDFRVPLARSLPIFFLVGVRRRVKGLLYPTVT